MKEVLEEVFSRELSRLNELSKERPLTLDELKALSLLTQSLKSYQEPTKSAENPLKDLTSEQLLAFFKTEEAPNDDKAQPGP